MGFQEIARNIVYTAVNADDLPVGTRVVAADTFGDMLKHIEEEDTNGRTVEGEIASIQTVHAVYRFGVKKSGWPHHNYYALACPVDSIKELAKTEVEEKEETPAPKVQVKVQVIVDGVEVESA